MRLFVGINLPSDVKDYLFDLQSELKNSSLAKVNWVFKKNLHLTLKFLGEIPDNKVDEIKNRLKRIKFNKFKAKLNGLGVFPNSSKINVIWVGADPKEKVIELQKLIDSETIDFGDLKLGAHITLGRVKFVRHKKGLIDHINNAKIDKISFEADSFTLFKSTLAKDGPTYDVLERYDLA